MTAHFIGGAVIGSSPDRGVIDGWQRVFGYDGLSVVDGSALSANLGANPSLTITAQAERAMAFWPNKGDPDPRPPVGATYEPVLPVPARHPTVAADVTARGYADTSSTTFFSTMGLHSLSAYDTGHRSPSSRFAASWKPRVEYL